MLLSLHVLTYPYFRSCSFISPAITLPAATLDLNAIDSPKLLQQGQSDQPPIPHPEHVAHSPRPTPSPHFRLPPILQFPNTLRLELRSVAFRPPLALFRPRAPATSTAFLRFFLHRPSFLPPHFTLVSLPPTFFPGHSALSTTYTNLLFPLLTLPFFETNACC